MSKVVDARDLNCPEPVILSKKAMEDGRVESLTVIVSNNIAMENVSKLANSQAYNVDVEEKENEYFIHMQKNKEEKSNKSKENVAVLISSQYFGKGEDQLGEVLMKSFLYSLNEIESGVSHLIFMNSGVYLTVEGSALLEHLQALEKKGTEILSCGTCLDFYHLKDKLQVGMVTNMYTAMEILTASPRQITI